MGRTWSVVRVVHWRMSLALLPVLLLLGSGQAAHAQAGGPKVIEGVPRIGWAAGKYCQHIAALHGALTAMGCPLGYEELLVASGTAFNTAWCPGRYYYACITVAPEDLLAEGASAAGATMERKAFASREEGFAAVCESIRQGRPVIAWKGWGAQVICGCDPQGQRMVVQDWNNTTDTYQAVPVDIPEALWPVRRPNEIILLEYDRNADRPALDWPLILDRAIRLADWPPTKRVGPFAFGLAAYDAWAATLRKGPDDNGPQTDVEFLDDFWRVLADARTGASVVLQESGTLHEAFPEAATHYMAEASLLKGMRTTLGAGPTQLFNEASAIMTRNFPNQAVREEAARLVEQAKAEEVQAVDALRRALKDLAAPQPPATEPKPLTTGPAPNAQQAEERYQRGLELKHAGQMTQAAEELRAAIAADPKHTKAHYALAWVLLDQKDKGGARAEFQKVIELAPDSEEAKEAQKALDRTK